ncbi:AtpZ/AtpI family protein [Thermodesulfobacteriota bacterium]
MPDMTRKKDRDFREDVEIRERRKMRSRSNTRDQVWFGLGMFGVVGWSVAVPTVLGAFIGIWIDLRWPSGYSWALMLIVMGLIVGYFNAWFWVNKQRKRINMERENGED